MLIFNLLSCGKVYLVADNRCSSTIVDKLDWNFIFSPKIVNLLMPLNRLILKKITPAIYPTGLQRFIFPFLLFVNFISTKVCSVLFSNNSILVSFSEIPVCNGVSRLNYLEKDFSFFYSIDFSSPRLVGAFVRQH